MGHLRKTPKEITEHIVSRRVAFRALVTDPETPTLAVLVHTIQPLSKTRVVELNIDYGPSIDPLDETDEVFLAFVDMDNLPGIGDLRGLHVWSSTQIWRVLGTPGNTIQTQSHENIAILVPKIKDTHDIETRRRRNALALIVQVTATGTPIIHVAGNVGLQSVLTQRDWGFRRKWDTGGNRKSRHHATSRTR